jgi:uncharacterized protein YmfQ (DUF2313 family)
MSERPYRLSADAFLRAILALLPRGLAWPTGDRTSVVARFYGAIADAMARHHDRALDLLHGESDPAATFELLPEWERMAGLPDPCAPVDATIEERRADLVQRLAARGGQSIAYFEGIADRLGYPVVIEERRPFTCGLSGCGETDEIAPPAIRYRWSVRVTEARVTHFRCGEGQAGVHALTMIRRAEDLECLLARLKPAHSALTLSYEGA